MTRALLAGSVCFAILPTLLAGGVAHAGSCSREEARSATEAAADTVSRLGVDLAKDLMDRREGQFSCGGYSVNIMDYTGTWLVNPDEKSLVGRNIASFGDGAATNFMKGLIKAAIESRGKLVAYFTTDMEGNVKINKALYYVDVPQHKVMIYGAFIVTQ
jgi:signal transduction histidine kinase